MNDLPKIVFYNKNIDDYEFILISDYDRYKYPIDTYVPIGIEVINNQFTDDGTSRILSMVNMSRLNPENGTIQDEEIKFGLENSTANGMECNIYIPTIDEDNNFFIWGNIFDGNNIYFPSSYFSKKYSDNSMRPEALFAPYPYDEKFNMHYEYGNMLEKLNGHEWTEKLLKQLSINRNEENNENETIEDLSNKTNAPALECIFNFNPINKGKGLWYMPNAAEWCHVLAKLYEINLVIKLLIKKEPLLTDKITIIKNKEYWTSSIINEELTSVIHFGCGQLMTMNKYQQCLVRPMIKI